MIVVGIAKKKFLQKPAPGSAGFTLIELMMAILLVGVLVSLAVPNFQRFFNNQGMIAQTQRLKTTLEYARNEAVARSKSVVVCASDDGATCLPDATRDWATGWIVYVDIEGAGFGANCDPTNDCLLKVDDSVPQSWTLEADGSWVGFDSSGALLAPPNETDIADATNRAGEFHLCSVEAQATNETEWSRTISVNNAGASRVDKGTNTCPSV